MTTPGARSLVLFDGLCNLCDATVNFIIDRDPRGQFAFASLQSPTGQRLVARFGLSGVDVNSVILVEGERYEVRSTAALEIARRLSGLWPMCYALIVVPRPIRDGLYRWVARNRYRWFGMRDACRLPTPRLADRFVDGDGVAPPAVQAADPTPAALHPDVLESERPRVVPVILFLLLLMVGFAVATFVPRRWRGSRAGRAARGRRTGADLRAGVMPGAGKST